MEKILRIGEEEEEEEMEEVGLARIRGISPSTEIEEVTDDKALLNKRYRWLWKFKKVTEKPFSAVEGPMVTIEPGEIPEDRLPRKDELAGVVVPAGVSIVNSGFGHPLPPREVVTVIDQTVSCTTPKLVSCHHDHTRESESDGIGGILASSTEIEEVTVDRAQLIKRSPWVSKSENVTGKPFLAMKVPMVTTEPGEIPEIRLPRKDELAGVVPPAGVSIVNSGFGSPLPPREVVTVIDQIVSSTTPKLVLSHHNHTLLIEAVEVDALEEAEEMDLMNGSILKLPENPSCPKLRLLSLQANRLLRVIPPQFFRSMTVLRNLNLSETGIKHLPQSLFRLAQLQKLALRGCELLTDLPDEIGQLRRLDVLDLEGTEIVNLPTSVRNLTNLTCLRLSFSRENAHELPRRIISENVISSLSQLEELSIDVNPEDERWRATVRHVVKEICRLNWLSSLRLYLPDDALLRDLTGTRLLSRWSRFRLTIGSHLNCIISRLPPEFALQHEGGKRCVRYVNGKGPPTNEIKRAVLYATSFFLDRHSTVTSLSDFGAETLYGLKFCILKECNEVEAIVGEADPREIHSLVLRSLEHLILHYLKNLRRICTRPLHPGSLYRLKSLKLYSCPRLTTIFTWNLLGLLRNLEEVVVEDCPEISSLVAISVHDDDDHKMHEEDCFLPKLKKIALHYMPKLVTVARGVRIGPRLEWISCYDCPNLKILDPGELMTSADLKVIAGEADWWNALKWDTSECSTQHPPDLDGIFVPIERDTDLMTQLARIDDQLRAPKPKRKQEQNSSHNHSGLTEAIEVDELEEAEEMDLMNSESISKLPENPSCPKLRLLSLQANHRLRVIPPQFFRSMTLLRNLNLSRTGIKHLPQSLFRLPRLRQLTLKGCELLTDLPDEIGQLRLLDVLDLEGTEIVNLPTSVQNLTNLTCLRLSFSFSRGRKNAHEFPRRIISENVISSLPQLEELSIDVNPEDERWRATVRHVVKEICCLSRLTSLRLYLPDDALLSDLLGTRLLSRYLSRTRFRLTVGDHLNCIISRLPPEFEAEHQGEKRCVRYVNGKGPPTHQIKRALRCSTSFFLDRHSTATSLSDFGPGTQDGLKFCILKECNAVEAIVGEAYRWEEHSRVLGSLEHLILHYLKNLRRISTRPLGHGSLYRLKALKLYSCPQLTTIFTRNLLGLLRNLEEVVVEDCPEISSLVAISVHDDDHHHLHHKMHEEDCFLPKLKKIALHYMPKLVTVAGGVRIGPRLEWISCYDCPNLKTLDSGELMTSADLKVIAGEADWWNALKWDTSECSTQRPPDLDGIFVPIERHTDLMTQLARIDDQLRAPKRKPKQEQKSSQQQPGIVHIPEAIEEQAQSRKELLGVSTCAVLMLKLLSLCNCFFSDE